MRAPQSLHGCHPLGFRAWCTTILFTNFEAARHALRWCSGRECWGEAGKALQAANAWIVRLSIVAPQLVNTCLYQRCAHNLRDDDTTGVHIQALV